MRSVYALLCQKGRIYVGKTDRPIPHRIEDHFSFNGSEWTRLYRPIKVIEHVVNADEFDEDKYTKKYMKKYGIDKVRGGSYSQIQLPAYSIKALEMELCSASDLCFRCNRPGHFANQCYALTKNDGSKIMCWCCDFCDKEFDTKHEAGKHEKTCKKRQTCFRCGRAGHYANDCYAKSYF